MPEEVEDCVDSVLDDNPDMDESSAYAICYDQQKAREEGADDPEAAAAVAFKHRYGEWPGIHPGEKTSSGRERLLETYNEIGKELAKEDISKSATDRESVQFKAQLTNGVQAVFKADDRFVVWGPASVEVVDKENDLVTTEALEEALPQLMRRKRMSWEHSDQIVGDVLENFEADEPTTVEFNGHEVTRKEFPTDVMYADEDGVPEDGLYVASEVWDDTRAAREVRQMIEDGEIDSYSISGEAITSKTKVEGGDVYDEITDMDLSAVTYCEDGMNQRAKFGTITKLDGSDDPSTAKSAASSPAVTVLGKSDTTMSDENEQKSGSDEDLKSTFKEAAQEVIEDADFVTRSELDSMIEEKMESSGSTETEKSEEEEAEEKADEDELPDPEGDDDEEEPTDSEGEPPEEENEPPEPEDEPPDEPGPEDEPGKEHDEDELPVPEGDEDELPDPEGDNEDEEGDDEPEASEKMGADEVKDYLEGEVPDDIYDAVCDHLEDGESEGEEMEGEDGVEEVMEASDSEGGEAEQTEKSAVAEAGPDDYVEKSSEDWLTGAGIPSPGEEEVRKSTDEQPGADDTESGSAVDAVEKSEGSPGFTGAFYSNIPDSKQNAD